MRGQFDCAGRHNRQRRALCQLFTAVNMKEQKRDDDGWKNQCCVVCARHLKHLITQTESTFMLQTTEKRDSFTCKVRDD